MTDKAAPTPGAPRAATTPPAGSGIAGLRPDPTGAGDPLGAPGEAAGDFTLRPDPRGLHDPLGTGPTAAGAADRAGDAAAAVKAGVSDAGARAADLADEARERVGALHRRQMRRIDDLTVQGVDGLRRGRNAVERFVDENPLLVGVVGVAAGLLLGALLPRTRQEDRTLGPWADEARDQGLRYAREVTSMGREFVQNALDPDNVNAAVRKDADTDAPAPPPGERAQHTL